MSRGDLHKLLRMPPAENEWWGAATQMHRSLVSVDDVVWCRIVADCVAFGRTGCDVRVVVMCDVIDPLVADCIVGDDVPMTACCEVRTVCLLTVWT